ncbi:MAG: hypothetical protein LBL91_00045 [Lachnospiraceae bacterium]|jgi:hypothetical protein|nr:hypothetical protein [Lachnospiraceae bacterium]
MELMKNVFFNTDKLLKDTVVKISYTGKFFGDGSEKVFIHYGFGLLWENLAEIEMQKTELGFQAEIELQGGDTFNFCLRNEKNEWDNNDNKNYIFNIEQVETALVVQNENTELQTRTLSKAYIWSKKIRLAIYKIITYVPKLVSGNYKRKIKTGV